MSWNELVLIYSLVIVGCLAGGVYIGVAMGLAGVVGITAMFGTSLWQSIGGIVWNNATNFTLVAIPLFILMGEIVLQGGVAARFYTGLSRVFRFIPGGLAQTNIAGCAVFSAVSGSSVATAMTVGSVAVGEMRKRGYKDSLTMGTLTAGGSLGILIPPSIPMIVYGSMTHQSVIDLLMAGIVPGIVLSLLFCIYIGVRAVMDPSLVPPREQEVADIGGNALRDSVPIILLVGGIIVGMYTGAFTATEASAVGVVLAAAIAWYYGGLTYEAIAVSFSNTVVSSAVIMFITICAQILQYGIVVTGFGDGVARFIVDLNFSPFVFFCILLIIYILLGMVMEGLSMMLITVPLIYAPMIAMGFDGVWLCILIILLIELGQIHPPVGLNLFAIQSITPSTPLSTIAWSSLPYCFIIIAFAFLIYAFPGIVLWLPESMN
ncbi:TRAP transporter large permease [Mesorhizobium sp. LHD-90]|uniref:TRAP transporter large permease n=1 Tax=Mesorhizobium sp. LHD-90 TaxID=3071414 RepID=UPI0027E01D48|nr:TRAP transporter large permease [Mesorhizobium sp. LHD-90]MDQ6436968.1 TRAP transporter large permease [Mesorhizobium sp. LHD-90]